jgi:hypothetical protein
MEPMTKYVLEVCGQEFIATNGWVDLTYGIPSVWMVIKEKVYQNTYKQ